jgi:hypothetical protein
MANDIGWGEGACNNDIGWGLAQEYFSCSGGEVITPIGAKLLKTGQTTSYRTGDDGDLETGRETSFTVLSASNPFGNTNRFTDELGTQTYTNNIVIDWSTYDGSVVNGYYRLLTGNIIWNDAIDQCLALSVGAYTSGWRLVNRNEMFSLFNHAPGIGLNYVPFNINFTLWASTTWGFSNTFAFTMNSSGIMSVESKTGAGGNRLPARTFTVTGTILT